MRSIEDGRAALALGMELGRPVVLASDPGASGFAGVGWWAALVRALEGEFPGAAFTAPLDCGTAAGHVQAAIRAGVRDICFTGPVEVADSLTAIAKAAGARLHPPVQDAADLRGARDRTAWLRRVINEQTRNGRM